MLGKTPFTGSECKTWACDEPETICNNYRPKTAEQMKPKEIGSIVENPRSIVVWY